MLSRIMTHRSTPPLSFVGKYLLGVCVMVMGLFGSLQAQSAYYHLIAGSFDNFQAASELSQAVQGKGQAAVILFPNSQSDNYRVSVYSSLDRGEVVAYKKKLKGSQGYWVLTLSPQENTQAAPTTGTNKRTDRSSTGTAAAEEGQVYHLIQGSFEDYQTATRSVAALTEQGYEPYILFPTTNQEHYRVSVFRSTERAEIEAYSTLLKKRGKPGGWVYDEEPGLLTTFGQPVSTSDTRTDAARLPGVLTYHLIAGSFDRFDQASGFAEKLKARGLNTLIMFPETGISQTFRVSVYQSTQRERVNIFQKELKQRGQDTWIYTQN